MFKRKSIFTFSLVLFCSDLQAQECPPLPMLYYSYHQEYPAAFPLGESHFILRNITDTVTDLSINSQSALNSLKEGELKEYFRTMLWRLPKLNCSTGESLENKLFLFQTQEAVKNPERFELKIRSEEAGHLSTDSVMSVAYSGNYQRDIIRTKGNDSVQVSNWYVKRFSADEIIKIEQQRKICESKTDSLYAEHIQQKGEHSWDWQGTQRKQVDSLERLIDSIDYLISPSLALELKPWYNKHPKVFGWSITEQIVSSDDPFLKHKFKLLHGYINNSSQVEYYFLGDSTLLPGTEIYEAKEWKYMKSWGVPRISFSSMDGKYLIVTKTEESIGETYWLQKDTFYVYEVQE